MAHTKELLDQVELDDLIDRTEVVRESFKGENGTVEYNRLVIHFTNGDKAELKLSPVNKATVFYALKDAGLVK